MEIAGDDDVLKRQLDAWWKYFVVEMGAARVVSKRDLDLARPTLIPLLEHETMRTQAMVGDAVAQQFMKVEHDEMSMNRGGIGPADCKLIRARAWVLRPM